MEYEINSFISHHHKNGQKMDAENLKHWHSIALNNLENGYPFLELKSTESFTGSVILFDLNTFKVLY